jgi:hypothetical protein
MYEAQFTLAKGTQNKSHLPQRAQMINLLGGARMQGHPSLR